MLSRIWYSTSLYHLFLLPFSLLYGLISTLIKFGYRCGCLKSYKFPLTIVVIGNLTVGGNGKTPMVLWLVEQLQHRGWLVGVVSRGYGGYSKRYPIILNEFSNTDECGDEPLLIWERTGVPIAVSPRRAEAVAALLYKYKLNVIISDDGLQHYALERDIEWVVVAQRRFGNGWWLPAGPMRERITRLSSVHEIIVNGEQTKVGEIPMKLVPSMVVNVLNGKCHKLNILHNVVAMAGIGHPDQFFATLRSSGIFPIKEIVFTDHAIYHEETLAVLTMNNEMLLMTEKDAVKCRKFAHINWWYLRVDVDISRLSTEKLLFSIENSINQYYYRL
ncbi:tetraacyldisaccharide 4'-kinase [Blochmannia endosymbiont of Camponotus (Colobopsis) obliquus]|uniref:tetraacyldisaccharide 4'-kinase n=1 Tax=Blochmannia endosymbiont of Camponotus (Colobopsis) obliquus TaxID=1505597 RepID=UPI00061A72B4|nr:tetraacyldisaccharide 4'-kinase [Blochmannia endosymbiont of Camponotus (Colobopsis) obliquus]AKC60537.1 tetraacyldisaccharide 4'-kinase [Blochmannia endosymbiont of Camponotus (Colobopsis) obliquus]